MSWRKLTKVKLTSSTFCISCNIIFAFRKEALKAAVSEKDAHLALLEHSGIKTAAQSEQADQLKADRKWLLEKLKKEVHNIQQIILFLL